MSKGSRPSPVKTVGYIADILHCQATEIEDRPAAFGEVAEAVLQIKGLIRAVRQIYSTMGDLDEKQMFSSESAEELRFRRDVEISYDTPLFFFTICRYQARFESAHYTELIEEGLALTQHLDGFVRVGYMRVVFKREHELKDIPDTPRDCKETTIRLY